MHDNRTHPLLQQLPLTVSPFVSLPSSVTLPYTYKPMPSALPPSPSGVGVNTPNQSEGGDPTASASSNNKPKYIISPASGHAAHPDDIIASCQALQAHVAKLQSDASAELKAFEERIKKRELAEKRRVAPGWLDSEARLLEPERKGGNSSSTKGGNGGGSLLDAQDGESDEQQGGNGGKDGSIAGLTQRFGGQGFGLGHGNGGPSEMAVPDQGEELDRAFGVVGMGQR
ncbi:hypothetical protein GE21DRAFT_7162 [Neurospora crassa]|uniref:Uncharacterized protein n=2 Tax=Neurospora crassa TaxID=5141 RepID=Q7S772_NEUCR|nr:hypothetical protein NCU03589 [Neurospora crassa OR74A]EAA31397.1 hypothetical protein NCU03589 [Neurospora crassa OR74A]KHE78514.1 hypothetical protein GE21DRAFT_7162 [Neurospora crassa]CAE76100.1 hypothetical protein [Neurospora crassa]|eukprot:XP_960633.1 hypothetical protein NCU03589 [Neurospora crassa OR74A]